MKKIEGDTIWSVIVANNMSRQAIHMIYYYIECNAFELYCRKTIMDGEQMNE